MPKAVLDTTVLVSALLTPGPQGASYVLLQYAKQGTFELRLSDDILEETAQALRRSRLKERYGYSDPDVVTYCQELALLATIVGDLPDVHAVRDPDDDVIVATALAAGADYIVARDRDLLFARHLSGHRGHLARAVPAVVAYVRHGLTAASLGRERLNRAIF